MFSCGAAGLTGWAEFETGQLAFLIFLEIADGCLVLLLLTREADTMGWGKGGGAALRTVPVACFCKADM